MTSDEHTSPQTPSEQPASRTMLGWLTLTLPAAVLLTSSAAALLYAARHDLDTAPTALLLLAAAVMSLVTWLILKLAQRLSSPRHPD